MEARSFSRNLLATSALLGVSALPCAVWGQTTEATRAAARQLATEGVAKFEEGEFVSASDKLDRAFETLRAPSLGLWSARALARCGRLVEASERYLEVTRLDPRTGDEAVQRQAQSDAIHEYDALQSRIPRVTLALSNRAAEGDLRVTLDGVLLPASLLRAQVPVDPGPHVIVATQGALSAKQSVTFAEGARVNVSLQLAYVPGPASPVSLGLPSARSAAGAPTRRVDASKRQVPTAVWVTLAGAGAGLIVGSVSGLMAMSERAPVASHCPNGVCPPDYWRDVDRLNSLRHVSSAAFAVSGAALLGVGAWWWFAPSARPAQAFVRPQLGLGQLSLAGAF